MAKKKELLQQIQRSRPNEKYFNCNNKSHYDKNYLGCINLRKKLEDKKEEEKVKCLR